MEEVKDDPREPQTLKAGDRVLVAVDGSEYSDFALQFYMDQIHKPDNEVIMVHCTELKSITYPAVAMMTGDPSSMATEEIESEEQKTTALVEALSRRIEELKINGHTEAIHGEPGPAICSLAHDKHVDYIVVGCRGKGAVRRTLTGSVTDFIVHHAKVPVMVARHKDHLEKHGFHLHNPFHRHHKKSESEDKK
ncbi:Y1388-like protein [Mya arenaria]|uniref:Y1388-like protein n=1 Tax=Mya arenaria TaxID=6604 RepID=A0ABY7DVL0_MYAAR|nr:universal stress protein Slr1101-like [Mya arenaria]WAR00902.1 Y1388-like protein [Mya arenaria]